VFSLDFEEVTIAEIIKLIGSKKLDVYAKVVEITYSEI